MNRAVIIPFFILIAVIVSLREWQWLTQYEIGIPAGTTIAISTPLEMTMSNCIISYKGWEVLVKRSVCTTTGLDAVEPGDRLTLISSCTLELTQHYTYKKFQCIAQNLTVSFIHPQPFISGWWWVRQLVAFRERLITLYQACLPEPHASLVAGVVLGEQGNLPSDFYRSLQLTGTMHVVAASGYNVSVVVALALVIGVRLFGRKGGLWMALACTVVYVLLAGATPPLLRAGLMGMVMVVGVYFGREYWSLYSLVVVSSLLLVWQPWLFFSLSFQLSVAATVGVVGGTRAIEHVLWMIFGYKNILLSSFATTVAASIMTWPLSLMTFGETSLWGLLVNPLILWLVPALMYLGGLVAALGILWFPLAQLVSWILTPLATIFVVIITVVGERAGLVELSPNWYLVWGWWVVWIGLAWWINKRILSKIDRAIHD